MDDVSADVPDELVDGIRSLDGEAWERLYRHMYRPLIAHARRKLGSLDKAEDAVSETMERAVVAVERFEPTGADSLRRWLFGIMRNVIREQWRQSARAAELPERLEAPVAGPGPAETIESDETRTLLREAFHQLSEADQETLGLRLVAELSSDDVATIQGRGSGAVRMAQARALERLRDRIQIGGKHE